MRKRILKIGTVFILIAGIVGGILFWQHFDSMEGNATGEPIYSFSQQKHLLKKNYPDFYNYLKLDNNNDAPVIPELLSTSTIKVSNNSAAKSTAMDPQGVVRAEDYLLVSAYSRDYAHNSVILVIDARTGSQVKTVVLPSTAHVGGITYDDVNKNIWLCTSSGEGAGEISAISYDHLAADDFASSRQPIEFDQSYDLGNITQASFITYNNNGLFIGYFAQSGDGLLLFYSINSDGTLDFDTSNKLTLPDGESLAKPEQTYPLSKKIQGIMVYKNMIVLSKSFGAKDSEIQVFKFTNNKNINLDATPDLTIVTPPYMEQISDYNQTGYVVFESGANHYRTNKMIVKVDRILQLDLVKILNDLS
ncbi:hypothetical protein [Enterococcus sp. AZ103]|uniref:hypothetical protein n=1 Tax=Enterococcus sp. AZ103 TaxID=2774628 RepID=UPI003F288795